VAFLAFKAADIFYGDFIALAGFEFFVVTLVLFVVSVIGKFDLCFAGGS
jgi:hypothetical protein